FGAARHDDRYVRARHRSRIGESLVRTLVGAAIVDDEVAALGEPELLQFGDKGPISQSTGDGVVEPGVEHADAGDLRGRLLRPRRERPRCRTAEQSDELAPPHSITSSARASNVGGTSRPSAFAVVRLTTSSNLVGCSTGRSAGFAPRRILST